MPRLLNVAVISSDRKFSPLVASVDDVTNIVCGSVRTRGDPNDKAAILTFDRAEPMS